MNTDEVILNPPKQEEPNEAPPLPKEPIYKKKVTNKGKIERAKSKGKRASYKFDEEKYKETEIYDETIDIETYNRRGQWVITKKPTGRTLERKVLKKEFIEEYGMIRNKISMHKAKCCYRTCEFFDSTAKHIKSAYSKLAGKRIDGFWVTDLFDRFGWSNGEQLSRSQLAKSYNKRNINSVDIAQEKLYGILNTADVEKSYVALIVDIKEEFAKDLKEKTIYGE